jgi:hypothetical protein
MRQRLLLTHTKSGSKSLPRRGRVLTGRAAVSSRNQRLALAIQRSLPSTHRHGPARSPQGTRDPFPETAWKRRLVAHACEGSGRQARGLLLPAVGSLKSSWPQPGALSLCFLCTASLGSRLLLLCVHIPIRHRRIAPETSHLDRRTDPRGVNAGPLLLLTLDGNWPPRSTSIGRTIQPCIFH